MIAATADDYRQALEDLLTEAAELGFTSVDLSAAALHRRLGGYPPVRERRMPTCCHVMRQRMMPGDEIVAQPASGQGASLTVRYRLRRDA